MPKSKQKTEVIEAVPTKKWYQINSKINWKSIGSGIIGLGQLLAVGSIVYSSAVITLGTEGITPLIAITPQAVLAAAILLKKFTK